MESNNFDENGLQIFTKAEIEAKAGKYDKDGFYIMEDGSFYDHNGYHFN